ncbi:MAG TPA: hypothetical protein VE377_25065 [Candidatus Dormibacteraeota bacterium]|nr:hypothetical protein [Candidatus Dormibacteraeota bacterium]
MIQITYGSERFRHAVAKILAAGRKECGGVLRIALPQQSLSAPESDWLRLVAICHRRNGGVAGGGRPAPEGIHLANKVLKLEGWRESLLHEERRAVVGRLSSAICT